MRVFAAMRATLPRQQQQQHVTKLGSRRAFSSNKTGSTGNKRTDNSSSSESFFKRAWVRYSVLLETHPITTKIVTGSVIAGIGDANCQLFLEADKPFHLKRAVVFTFLGGVIISPILHGWYKVLTRVAPGTSTLAVAKRLALDQFGFAPTFLPIFFTILLTLEGDIDKVPDKLAHDWWPAVKANWVVWIPAQLVNFRFVPGSYQVLFSNTMGLFWNSYLSYVSHTDAHSALEAAAPLALPLESTESPASTLEQEPVLVAVATTTTA